MLNARFDQRAGLKFISEYDVDFSKATIDGRLTEGFDPEETLKRIQCPVLLIHAYWSRHKTWGLIGAMDDNDVEKIRSGLKDIKVVKVNAIHDVHLVKPKIFIKVVSEYLDNLIRGNNSKITSKLMEYSNEGQANLPAILINGEFVLPTMNEIKQAFIKYSQTKSDN